MVKVTKPGQTRIYHLGFLYFTQFSCISPGLPVFHLAFLYFTWFSCILPGFPVFHLVFLYFIWFSCISPSLPVLYLVFLYFRWFTHISPGLPEHHLVYLYFTWFTCISVDVTAGSFLCWCLWPWGPYKAGNSQFTMQDRCRCIYYNNTVLHVCQF